MRPRSAIRATTGPHVGQGVPVTSSARPQADQALDAGVRLGLVVYGLVHLLLAYTAIRLALGDRDHKASQQGAISDLAQTGAGATGLVVVAVGFGALVVWQVWEAASGHRDEDGAKRVLKRVSSAVRAVVYGALGMVALQKAFTSGSSGGGTDSMTRQVMKAPGGQTLVGVVGLVVVGVGVYLVYHGVTRKFRKRLDAGAAQRDRRTAIETLGMVGYVAKGVALAMIGALFVVAAWQFQPEQSGGLDQALRALLQQPFGPALVGAVGVGFAAFGVFCLAWARHRDESR